MRLLSRVMGTLDAWTRIGGLAGDALYGDVARPDLPVLAIRSAASGEELRPQWLAEVPEEDIVTLDAGRWLHIEQADAVNALLANFYQEP